jgi:hypothetical protein
MVLLSLENNLARNNKGFPLLKRKDYDRLTIVYLFRRCKYDNVSLKIVLEHVTS